MACPKYSVACHHWHACHWFAIPVIEDRAEQGSLEASGLNMAYFRNCCLNFDLEGSIVKVVGYCMYQELMACGGFFPESVLDVRDDTIVQGVFFNSF
ncbi:hypothetical protein TNCV_4779681 [Trichonephila clavipes]|nr:hypothetical protein TNCV_4779681 [Trichonephila clavipes]